MTATPDRAITPPMDRERWRAVDALLQAALDEAPAEREAFVRARCTDDRSLADEVLSLLALDDDAGRRFLEQPAAAAADAPAGLVPPEQRLGRALDGRYTIERELARGGMATVYLAHDLRHDRRVAIKVLREDLAAAVGLERFLAEIRVTASLQHPNILPLFDSGVADGLPWYAMPWVEGDSLRARLSRDGALPEADAIRIAREVADGLAHAHRQGVVHRDLKPENILLRDGHAVVADFGIALALEQAGGERLTRTGVALGTPRYMAPEQAAAGRPVDARADVYALGAVLQEMVAGPAPVREAPVLHPARMAPGAASPALAATIQRALQPDVGARWGSAADFRAALARVEAPLTRPEGPALAPPQRQVRARTAAWVAVGALIAGFACGLLVGRPSLLDRLQRTAETLQSPPVANAISAAMLGEPAGELIVVDRKGRPEVTFDAPRPWAPRFAPDGHRLAYGAFDGTRRTSDLFLSDLDGGTTRRLTNDDRDANDPQWSPDGTRLVYSVGADGGKDLEVRPLASRSVQPLAIRPGTQYPTDWLPNGAALLVTEEGPGGQRDIVVQPVDGSAARPWVATPADESAARVSPDGRWVAYTSNESGHDEVYLDAFPVPGQRIQLSSGMGLHPVWRADGRELYYWEGDALVALQLARPGESAPTVTGRTVLFHLKYPGGANTRYDVSPDGQRFAIVRSR